VLNQQFYKTSTHHNMQLTLVVLNQQFYKTHNTLASMSLEWHRQSYLGDEFGGGALTHVQHKKLLGGHQTVVTVLWWVGSPGNVLWWVWSPGNVLWWVGSQV
jgi:hypothetical protein